jgi:hypothetical protein
LIFVACDPHLNHTNEFAKSNSCTNVIIPTYQSVNTKWNSFSHHIVLFIIPRYYKRFQSGLRKFSTFTQGSVNQSNIIQYQHDEGIPSDTEAHKTKPPKLLNRATKGVDHSIVKGVDYTDESSSTIKYTEPIDTNRVVMGHDTRVYIVEQVNQTVIEQGSTVEPIMHTNMVQNKDDSHDPFTFSEIEGFNDDFKVEARHDKDDAFTQAADINVGSKNDVINDKSIEINTQDQKENTSNSNENDTSNVRVNKEMDADDSNLVQLEKELEPLTKESLLEKDNLNMTTNNEHITDDGNSFNSDSTINSANAELTVNEKPDQPEISKSDLNSDSLPNPQTNQSLASKEQQIEIAQFDSAIKEPLTNIDASDEIVEL